MNRVTDSGEAVFMNMNYCHDKSEIQVVTNYFYCFLNL